jgi:hypothetical protein
MSYQSATIYKDVLHTRIELASMGIEYVQVNSMDNSQSCDYCIPMHGSIIPVEAISQLAEYCKNEQGCCCQFEPTFGTD